MKQWVNECVTFNVPLDTQQVILAKSFFPAIDRTGTDDETKQYLHLKHKRQTQNLP